VRKRRALLVCAIACALLSACAGHPKLQQVDVASPILSRFQGHPVTMHAAVLLPGGYSASSSQKYPVVYWVPAFGGSYHVSRDKIRTWQRAMQASGQDFIVVFLDAAVPSGHSEFADSANNGPWARALTTELIPDIERRFHALATPQARLLAGHSSGGWSVLWLQVTYPTYFGGAWAIAPDPVDFRDFIGPDLTAKGPSNFYRDSNGREYGFVRLRGRDATTLRRYVTREDSNGPGNQIASFDAVFSPRGADGKPEQLFDHRTGAIHPAVERYWVNHYDIARIVASRWPALAVPLRGKLHIFVGSADTFHLERPVRLLATQLAALHSEAEVRIAPGYDHFTIFNYDGGLISHIVAEMTGSLPPAAKGSNVNPHAK
jgi:S-formylglutathione hydrolase FrmB